jgi:hypothetical protein
MNVCLNVFWIVDMVILHSGDEIEVWISESENFDINNITLSSYKNHTTGTICLWTLPPGFLLKCTDAFPGIISNADITEQSCVLDSIPKGKTLTRALI